MVEDSLTEFDRSLVQIGIDSMDQTMRKNEMPGLDSVKVIAGIKLPPAVATLRYSAKIKTEAVLRLGFYNAVKVLKQVLKKPFRNELERQKNALRDGGQRMKHETEKSMQSHLKDYRENIKFQYLFRLADAVAEALKDTMIGRLQAYAGSLIKMIDDVRDRKLDKTRSMEMLGEMHRQAAQIDTSIQRLEDGIRGLEKKD
jgi:hypothetical protein